MEEDETLMVEVVTCARKEGVVVTCTRKEEICEHKEAVVMKKGEEGICGYMVEVVSE